MYYIDISDASFSKLVNIPSNIHLWTPNWSVSKCLNVAYARYGSYVKVNSFKIPDGLSCKVLRQIGALGELGSKVQFSRHFPFSNYAPTPLRDVKRELWVVIINLNSICLIMSCALCTLYLLSIELLNLPFPTISRCRITTESLVCMCMYVYL